MKKVLIIANEWTTIVHFRMEVLQSLLNEGYQVGVALPVCDEAQPIRDIGCDLINLDVSRHGTNPVEELKMFQQCKVILKTYMPDVVITYTVKPNIYGSLACVQTKIPYLNNVTGVGSVLQSKSPMAKVMLSMMKIAFRKSSCVLFQNEDNYKRFLHERVISDTTPVDFLPGSGVNLEKFSYKAYPADSSTKFVMVSRIRRDKGYAEFFDAAEKIKSVFSNVEFHVIGWYEDENLRSRINYLMEKNIIIYHGSLPQEKVYEEVASCSCLVHPSYHEGMANVILEAAAIGRPVIASDISGCREAVEDGKTGFVCKVKNSESLAKAMEKFIALVMSERIAMGKAGREKMEREFNRNIVADKIKWKIAKII